MFVLFEINIQQEYNQKHLLLVGMYNLKFLMYKSEVF